MWQAWRRARPPGRTRRWMPGLPANRVASCAPSAAASSMPTVWATGTTMRPTAGGPGGIGGGARFGNRTSRWRITCGTDATRRSHRYAGFCPVAACSGRDESPNIPRQSSAVHDAGDLSPTAARDAGRLRCGQAHGPTMYRPDRDGTAARARIRRSIAGGWLLTPRRRACRPQRVRIPHITDATANAAHPRRLMGRPFQLRASRARRHSSASRPAATRSRSVAHRAQRSRCRARRGDTCRRR